MLSLAEILCTDGCVVMIHVDDLSVTIAFQDSNGMSVCVRVGVYAALAYAVVKRPQMLPIGCARAQ
jgi:hypothetical protein